MFTLASHASHFTPIVLPVVYSDVVQLVAALKVHCPLGWGSVQYIRMSTVMVAIRRCAGLPQSPVHCQVRCQILKDT